MVRIKGKIAISILAPCFCLISADLLANGYNKISHIAIPALIILAAFLYGIAAPFPALVVYAVARFSLAAPAPHFAPLFLGSFLGGEGGIALSVVLGKILSVPGEWNSYHYTLYPWVILGLSLAGSAIGLYLNRRPKKV